MRSGRYCGPKQLRTCRVPEYRPLAARGAAPRFNWPRDPWPALCCPFRRSLIASIKARKTYITAPPSTESGKIVTKGAINRIVTVNTTGIADAGRTPTTSTSLDQTGSRIADAVKQLVHRRARNFVSCPPPLRRPMRCSGSPGTHPYGRATSRKREYRRLTYAGSVSVVSLNGWTVGSIHADATVSGGASVNKSRMSIGASVRTRTR